MITDAVVQLPLKKPQHTASECCRTAIPAQFMLWKQCCQAALSLTLSCDNPSSVIHKQLHLGAGKDIKAILIQPVKWWSQHGGVGYGRSTSCRGEMDNQLRFSLNDTFACYEHVYGFIWAHITIMGKTSSWPWIIICIYICDATRCCTWQHLGPRNASMDTPPPSPLCILFSKVSPLQSLGV